MFPNIVSQRILLIKRVGAFLEYRKALIKLIEGYCTSVGSEKVETKNEASVAFLVMYVGIKYHDQTIAV